MKKIVTLFLTLILVYAHVDAQTPQNPLFGNRKEIVFSFSVKNANEKTLDALSNMISIDKVTGDEVVAYANAREFENFLQLGIDYQQLTPPSMLQKPVMKSVIPDRNTNDWDYYPTYDAYVTMMNQFAADYPDLCELVNIGTTNEGRALLFIHINNNLGQEVNEPEFMYTSTMHGDEVTGYVLMLRLIDYLLSNYGDNDKVTNLVNNVDIWINPLANPDGTYAGGNNTVYGATRANALGVDLNRNYADPEDGPHPDGNEYQVETLAFMEFAANHHLNMSANFHGGAEVLNYPWDTWQQLHADNDWWIYVCREYADTVHAHSPSGYLTDLNNGITNGYAWYTTSGCRQDYMNYFEYCREVTMEISSQKTPSASQLPNYWEYNYRSLLNFMEQSTFGVSGLITDQFTGEPIEAKMYVNNHDNNNSWVYSRLPVGDYHRYLKSGGYNVTYSATGYYPKTVTSIPVLNRQKTPMNIQLEPIIGLSAEFHASRTVIGVNSPITFIDESFGGDIISWNWTFQGGTPPTSVAENPMGIVYQSPGSYDAALIVSDMNGDSDTELKEDYIQVYETYEMTDGEATTCRALFYDAGGEFDPYGNNQDDTFTFFPGEDNKVIMMEFLEFNLEDEANCDYDYLEFFNGPDASAPTLGKFCGTNSPGTVRSSDVTGALTLRFHSDNSEVRSGWKAIVACDSNVGVVNTNQERFSIYPNPAKDQVTVELGGQPTTVIITDMMGRLVYQELTSENKLIIPVSHLRQGLYLVSVKSGNEQFSRKITIR